jgi:hypothetical protein
MSADAHTFAASEWPVSDPTEVAAISTRHVIDEGYPILWVTRDENGDWQVLCGTTNQTEDARVVCLGCLFERDRRHRTRRSRALGSARMWR